MKWLSKTKIDYKGKKVLAVIPMRGGSKGLPGKNAVKLLGKPLMYYTIKDAQRSRYINRIVAFTDDEKLAKMARKFGAETPVAEPAWLGADNMNENQIFPYLLEQLANQGYHPDIVLQLRVISPLRPRGIIDRGIEMLVDGDADCVRAMSLAPVTPYKLWVPNGNGFMKPFVELQPDQKDPRYKDIPSYNMPRQDLPAVYWHNPLLDVIWRDTIMKKKSMCGERIIPLFIDDLLYSIDVDTQADLLQAESAMRLIRQREKESI